MMERKRKKLQQVEADQKEIDQINHQIKSRVQPNIVGESCVKIAAHIEVVQYFNQEGCYSPLHSGHVHALNALNIHAQMCLPAHGRHFLVSWP